MARNVARLRELQAEIARKNGISLVLECDITDQQAVARLYQRTMQVDRADLLTV